MIPLIFPALNFDINIDNISDFIIKVKLYLRVIFLKILYIMILTYSFLYFYLTIFFISVYRFFSI